MTDLQAKMNYQVAYVPIGVGTFHMESATAAFEATKELLGELAPAYGATLAVPEEMLLTIDALDAYLATINPDLIILQNLTFANGAYASQVLAAFTSCPILLWSLREPVIDGGRLRLNSLTGGFSASNVYHQFRQEPLNYIYGGPAEEAVRRKPCTTLAAASLN